MIHQFTSANDCADAWAAFVSKDNEVANNLPTRVLSYCPKDEAELLEKQIILTSYQSSDGHAAGFAFMTPPHRIILSEPYPDDFECLVNWLIENDVKTPGVVAARESGLAFAKCWTDKTQTTYTVGHDMTIYELRDEVFFPERPCPGRIRLATMDDHNELTDWMVQFETDAGLIIKNPDPEGTVKKLIEREEVFIWENISGERMGCTRRLSLADNGCCVNFVFTPQAKRNHGVASQLVAAVSHEFLEKVPTGYCCLFTDNANPTSNSIYQKIGYREVAQFIEIDFI